MKKFFAGVVAAGLLALAGYGVKKAYVGAQYAKAQWGNADVSANYLFGPAGVSTKDGRELSREQLFDALLKRVVEQDPNLKLDPEKK